MIYQRSSERHLKGKEDSNPGRALETKASYQEPRVKTYGFQTLTNLCLFQMTAPHAAMAALGLALIRLGEEGVAFHLVFSRATIGGMELSLLVSLDVERAIARELDALVSAGLEIRRLSPTELVFFHGPHFGDRNGIFLAAAQALAVRGLSMHAYACSGSCIHIVLPSGKSGEAVQALSGAFEIPRRQAVRT